MSEVKVRELKLFPYYASQLAFAIDDVFTEEECNELITETETHGYEEALVNIGYGVQKKMRDIRNSSRCIIDDPAMAKKIWDRIEFSIPKLFKEKKVIGLNERLRFLRYDPGEYFKPHKDGSYETPDGKQRSLITIQLYLNQGFTGGETTFIHPLDENITTPYVPKTGSVLVFQHNLLHEGSTLVEGRKYTMRTDVMYES